MDSYKDLCYLAIGFTCNNVGGLFSVVVGFFTIISVIIEIYFKIKNKGK
ncbi:MAG: hypothetical protein Ta2D_11020 [Rickettsiales bacterium]|nr:MAG: hypothetical protein Ta2D_11020 [Rickettsiales bacterium]